MANFGRAFVAGARLWDSERDCTYTVDVVHAGELSLESGVAVLAAPFGADEHPRAARALSVALPSGRWPTELSVLSPIGVDESDGDSGRIVGARVIFGSDASAVRWEPVLRDSDGHPIRPYAEYPSFRLGGFDASGSDVVLCDGALWNDRVAEAIAGGEAEAGGVRPVRGTSVEAAGADVLILDPCGDDLMYLWWGLDRVSNVVEIIVEVDRLVRETWPEVTLPAEVLDAPGLVPSDELDAVGVVLEVLGADDFPGPWLNDYSTWPAEHRPWPGARPDITTVFRTRAPIEGTAVRLDPLDAAGNLVWLDGAHTTRQGWTVTYWAAREAVSRVKTLRIRVPLSLDR